MSRPTPYLDNGIPIPTRPEITAVEAQGALNKNEGVEATSTVGKKTSEPQEAQDAKDNGKKVETTTTSRNETNEDQEGEADNNPVSSFGGDRRDNDRGKPVTVPNIFRGEHHSFDDSDHGSGHSVVSTGHSIIYTLREETSDDETDSDSDGEFAKSSGRSSLTSDDDDDHIIGEYRRRQRNLLASQQAESNASIQRRENWKKGICAQSTKDTKYMGDESGSDGASGHDSGAGGAGRGAERVGDEPCNRPAVRRGSLAERRSVADVTDKIHDMAEHMVDNVYEKVDPTTGQTVDQKEYAFAMCLGLIMTFNMGYLNGACFSGFVVAGVKQPVAAFTNPYTDAALQLAEGNYERVKFQIIMIFCFIGGGFVSGAITPNAVPYRIEPTYGPSFLAAGAALCLASYFATQENHYDVAFYLAAAAGGIQNGITSAYTAKLIRSTGLTGSSTDIGIYLGQYVRGNKENKTKLLILIILAVSFTLGGLVSFYITQIVTSYALLIGAGFFLVIGVAITVFLVKKLSISFRSAMFGTWRWQAAADGIKEAFGEHFGSILEMDGSQPRAMMDHEIFEMFDRIDTDGSGTIDGEELYILLRSTGAKVTRKESDMMLQYADKDGNGELDKEEWKFVVETALSGRKTMLQATKKAVGSTVQATRRNLKASYEIMGSSARNLVKQASTRSLNSTSNHTNKSQWTGRRGNTRGKTDSNRSEEEKQEEASHNEANKGDVMLEEAPKGD